MTVSTFEIGNSANDGLIYGASGFVTDQTFLSFGLVGPNIDSVFLRFPTITIPKAAKILSAILKLTATDNLSGTTVNCNIYAEAADNPGAPTSYTDFNSRVMTNAIVAWNNISSWSALNQYYSPELKTIIQEIVLREGWSSGNALNIFIKDNSSSSYRTAYAYDNTTSSYRPTLTIEYLLGGQVIVWSSE
jgi:hypothetical protein